MRLIDGDEFAKDIDKCLRRGISAFVDKYEVLQRLNNAPTIDAEPVRHGKWVIEPDATVMHCNSCGWAYEYYAGLEEEWNFCSHCGAKMKHEKGDSNGSVQVHI